jgi:hypothetical protein
MTGTCLRSRLVCAAFGALFLCGIVSGCGRDASVGESRTDEPGRADPAPVAERAAQTTGGLSRAVPTDVAVRWCIVLEATIVPRGPAVVDQTIVVPTADGRLVGLDPDTGERLFEYPLWAPVVDLSSTQDGRLIVATSRSVALMQIRESESSLAGVGLSIVWERPLVNVAGVGVAGHRCAVVTTSGIVGLIEVASGRVAQQLDTQKPTFLPPVFTGEAVLVAHTDGSVSRSALRTGALSIIAEAGSPATSLRLVGGRDRTQDTDAAGHQVLLWFTDGTAEILAPDGSTRQLRPAPAALSGDGLGLYLEGSRIIAYPLDRADNDQTPVFSGTLPIGTTQRLIAGDQLIVAYGTNGTICVVELVYDR